VVVNLSAGVSAEAVEVEVETDASSDDDPDCLARFSQHGGGLQLDPRLTPALNQPCFSV